MARPVCLPLPPDAPEPAEGCDVCAALVKQRAEARASGDCSAASDRNVEPAAHPHDKATDQQAGGTPRAKREVGG
ncbi:hypothetical protein San01_28300 [Streptomyces angustmyceticus]|uniref:Uncharacterized protein n=1 Tax=Streptomyces angustmyceticus TaxID=285578 RepID=A0A5J4L867_9ACTN|nr:hypothetical protein [Streptomyces angustmyceticus]GES30343.1 hypothetical protein San01_28300 [Streptomyces angustmyceticus]